MQTLLAMIRGLPNPFAGKGAVAVAAKKKTEEGVASESDPLLLSNRGGRVANSGSIRARHSSRSPSSTNKIPMDSSTGSAQFQGHGDRFGSYRQSDAYGNYENASQASSLTYAANSTTSHHNTPQFTQQIPDFTRRPPPQRQEASYRSTQLPEPSPQHSRGGGHPPLLEIPEEVYAVRKAALQVLKPLTSSWLVVSVGFAITVLLAMARWTKLLPNLPYWFVLLPSWFSHVGLLWCHIRSARALSRFISQANDNRQRPDSTDHIDRTEYLPLLQRSLKFGLKTGLLSFCTFVFEVMVYVRIAKGKMPLTVCFLPMWMLVVGGVLDGIVCKTQSLIRLLSWILVFSSMIMSVLRIDFGHHELSWQLVVAPIVVVLSFATLALIYIVYGHQVGYYRLTESQLTAGILYSMSAVICIVLVIVVAQVMPLSRPVEIETRILVVIMAPLVVSLTGMGAYAVSRDEFGRLLLYGGQSAVHPMRLKWERKGWTSVPTRGVVIIPMFGEVSCRPLERNDSPTDSKIELCICCSCYPYEEEDDTTVEYPDHPYLTPKSDISRTPGGRAARAVNV